ncbi:response regulator [Desulfonema magnum]|uniref:histidine kinase n=1 Tax=Desulfonema magnum TaxID=45655 RepID=A0A975GNV0_9BACT|nr:response regulator [Desulfonema magnum]QTA88346.1 Two component system response regulator/histidine kinase, GAF domain-containing [Desulfonema magnum]
MNEKILIVDDEPDTLKFLEFVLSDEGFRITSASDGKKAIDVFRSEPFDLVITDLKMPEMEGTELIKQLKKTDEDVEIIVLTAFATVDNAIETLKDNRAFNFLKKPLEDIEVLFNVIRQALEKRRLRMENKVILTELRKHHDHLEELVAQRTSELLKTNKQLQLENKKRQQAEKALLREADVNAALTELAKTVISSESIAEISYLVLEKAKHFTTSVTGFAGYIEPETACLITPTLTRETWKSCRIPDKNFIFKKFTGLWGWVLKNKKPLLTNAPADDPSYCGTPEDHLPIRNFLSVPAMLGEKLVGQISVANSDQNYTRRDIELLEKLADLYSLAIRRKQSEDERDKLQAQVRHSQKMESLGTLAGGIAHDFNNILYGILGYADLAMDNIPKDSVAYNDISQILIAAKRASDLISQILTFSRQTETDRIPVLIHPIINESLKLLKKTMLTNIDIRHTIDKDCGPVLADVTQIHQVIINLCTNAYYSMRNQGGILEVCLKEVAVSPEFAAEHPDLREGRYARLTVKDTGHGIDKVTADRIFDPFFTTKPVGEGTGMGLSTVHGIVKDHNGVIIVESKPGKGTRFDVFLPVTDQKVSISRSKNDPSSFPNTGGNILFVDDEVMLGDTVRRNLARFGFNVTTFSDSIEALKRFRTNPDKFDLVIADMKMPGMTGVELAKKLLDIRPGIPIILSSGAGEIIREEKIRAMGIREYVRKPVEPRDLAKIILRTLKQENTEENIPRG